MEQVFLGAVVVVYNTTLYEYKSKLETYYNSVSFVCIINNSDVPQFIFEDKTLFDPKVIVVNFGENKGIAYALNFGIKQCKEYGCNYILTLDQDSYYSSIIDCFVLPDKSIDIYFPRYLVRDSLEEPTTIWQSGMIISTRWIDNIGWFNEDYFIDYVDYDFLERSKELGGEVKNLENVVLVHSPGAIKTRKIFALFKMSYISVSPIRYYYVMRNGFDYIRRYNKYSEILNLCKYFAKIIIQEDRKLIRFKYSFKGIKDYFTSLWGKCPVTY